MCLAPNKCDIALLRSIFHYDATGGVLTRITARGNRRAGAQVGVMSSHGYLTVEIEGRQFGVHRVAWAIYFGCWPELQLDHIDGNRTNNRIANLREATVSQNIANSRNYERKHRLPRGVYVQRGRITARVNETYLGQFKTVEAAAVAAREARKQLYGEFARGC